MYKDFAPARNPLTVREGLIGKERRASCVRFWDNKGVVLARKARTKQDGKPPVRTNSPLDAR